MMLFTSVMMAECALIMILIKDDDDVDVDEEEDEDATYPTTRSD